MTPNDDAIMQAWLVGNGRREARIAGRQCGIVRLLAGSELTHTVKHHSRQVLWDENQSYEGLWSSIQCLIQKLMQCISDGD
jgi:hypothetical protein